MLLILCALTGFFAGELAKVLWPTRLPSLAKVLIAVAGSFAVALLSTPLTVRHAVIYGLAGAGLAFLIHRLGRIMSVAGDWMIRSIMAKSRQR